MQQNREGVSSPSQSPLKCISKIRAHTNIDCIKICPLNQQLWAFAFYQQHPEFRGGLQIVTTSTLAKDKSIKLGEGEGYNQMGPIMHIEWLKKQSPSKQQLQYYILSAARCDEAIISSYQPLTAQLSIKKRVLLQTGVFCLYCDWRVILSQGQKQGSGDQLRIVAAVSTNQSSVFSFQIQMNSQEILNGDIQNFNKHEYAVWACRISPESSKNIFMVVGDEVNCLYLYDLNSKTLLAKNKSAHTQGICQIVWINSQTLMSGSFDGSLSLISVHSFHQTLRRIELGGTIWRIINFSQSSQKQNWSNLLICNSSQKLFQIVQTNPQNQIWNSGKEHQSLAYAAEFDGKYVITASFYDQEVRIWTTNFS